LLHRIGMGGMGKSTMASSLVMDLEVSYYYFCFRLILHFRAFSTKKMKTDPSIVRQDRMDIVWPISERARASRFAALSVARRGDSCNGSESRQ